MRGQVFSEADLRRKARDIADRFAEVDDDLILFDDDPIFGETGFDPAADVEPPELDEAERRWKARKLLEPLDEEIECGRVSTARLEGYAALLDLWVSDIYSGAPRRGDAAVVRQFLEARKLIRKTWKT